MPNLNIVHTRQNLNPITHYNENCKDIKRSLQPSWLSWFRFQSRLSFVKKKRILARRFISFLFFGFAKNGPTLIKVEIRYHAGVCWVSHMIRESPACLFNDRDYSALRLQSFCPFSCFTLSTPAFFPYLHACPSQDYHQLLLIQYYLKTYLIS